MEHPDITRIRNTGYPTLYEEDEEYLECEICEEQIFDECYQDEDHDVLCSYCLLQRHRKKR